jgi:subtilisin family serine protease
MSRVTPLGRSGSPIMWLLVAALFALAAAGSQSVTAASPAATDRIETGGAADRDGTGLWIVQLSDRSLATYRGGVAELPATSPAVTGATQLDATAPASVAYLEYLQSRHAAFRAIMERTLGRSVAVQFRYLNVLNAFAARMSAAEAESLEALPQVRAVYRDTERFIETDVSHDLIGSPGIWDGDTGSGVATRGEGVIVGMLDTGVNPDHPSFAATDGDGYTHTNPFGSGNFVGVCNPAHPNHEDICNDKLIGAWNFHPSSPSAQDWDDHGSHVGSTIAGNVHDANVQVGNDVHVRRIQGVAPRANVISYLVCFPSCPSTSSVAAVNQAIADGTNVLNYSISGVDNPWADAVDLAFLEAFQAGIFVSASAGNSGPGPSTVAKTGPWNASVAASTHERVIANTVDVTSPTPVPEELEGMAAVPGSGPPITADIEDEVRFAGLVAPGNELGCNPFPGGSFTGAIALIQRGACTFATKVVNAANAGAIAVIVFNNVGGPPISMGGLETTSIPAVFLDLANGNDLRDFIVDESPDPVEARINSATSLILNPDWEDIMAGFSSRGPSQFEMLAPTFTAPGVNILAAGREVGGNAVQYAFLQGTSMSSPHGAGSGALLRALHPTWSPAEIRSALASTAVTEGILKEDGSTPADPFDMGSGRIDLGSAGRIGLVMDETHANFVAANPAIGGDPKTLNLPAMVSRHCQVTCSWTRVVKSVSDATATYTATTTGPAGMNLTVTPSTFELGPGETQTLEITAGVGPLPVGEWAFGDVRLATDASHAGGEPIAAVHYPVAVIPRAGTPSITVSPEEISSSQAPGTLVNRTLTIGNAGDATLEWTVEEAEAPSGTAAAADAPTASSRASGARAAGAGTMPAAVLPAVTPAAALFLTEGFDDVGLLAGKGWGMTNNSQPLGTTGWFQGNPGVFPSHQGASNSYVAANFLNGSGVATISNWLLTPPLVLRNGETVSFYTRSTGSSFPDRLQVRMSLNGDSTDVGSTATSVGDFTELLAEINPGQTVGGYPTTWTEVSVTLSGISEPTIGRIAMRYFVTNGGPSGSASDYIGIDTFRFSTDPCDSPTNMPWLSASPATGTTAPGTSSDVAVSLDSTGLAPGTYEALLCVASNDPVNPLVHVPVTLDVTAPLYETLVNAGGDEYTDGNGDTWLADQAYVAGEWGYTRPQAPSQRTGREIAGTDDQPLYGTARHDPREYRFDGIPDGTYQIVLRFANLDGRVPGTRTFDIVINDAVALAAYDITGAVGNFHADEQTFVREITGGEMVVRLEGHRGAPPIISALAVRQVSTP